MYRFRLVMMLWALSSAVTSCATDPSTVNGFPADVTQDANAVTPIDVSDSTEVGDLSIDALGEDGTADGAEDTESDEQMDAADGTQSDQDASDGDSVEEDAPVGDSNDADSVDTVDSGGDPDLADLSDSDDGADPDSADVVPDDDRDADSEPEVVVCDPDEDRTGVRNNCAGLGLDAPIRVCLGQYEEQGDTTFLDVIIDNDVEVSGFQFKVSGVTLTGSRAGGGRAAEASLLVTSLAATGVVIGADTGADEPLPVGSGSLVTLEFESQECGELCLIPTRKFSDSDGREILHALGPCYSF